MGHTVLISYTVLGTYRHLPSYFNYFNALGLACLVKNSYYT